MQGRSRWPVVAASLISLVLILAIFGVLDQSAPAMARPQAEVLANDLIVDVVGPDTVLAGNTITYTLLVTNTTAQVLQGVVITNVWTRQTYSANYAANNLTVLNYTFAPTAAQPYIRWGLGPLAGGASGSLVLTMSVNATLQPSTTKASVGTPIILADVAAIATSTAGVSGSNDQVNTLIVGPVMYLEKSFAPAAIRPGRLLTFSLRLSNRSTAQRADSIPATGIVITERLPLNTSYWSAGGAATVSYSPTYTGTANGMVFWLLNDPLPPGQSVTVTLTLRVSPYLKNKAAVNNIVNSRAAYGFASTEVTIPRPGNADERLVGEDVLEKSVKVGPPPPPIGTPPRTFPKRFITYTVAVYNPFTETLNGLRITDSLPIFPNPGGEYFSHTETIAVAPYAPPAVVYAAGRTVVWDIPPIAAWDVYSFAVRVWIPPHYDTNGLTGRDADNTLFATWQISPTVIYDNVNPPEARVRVMPQVIPSKDVTPQWVYSGKAVTYTIRLTNTGNTDVTALQVTDLLPGGFEYDGMLIGPTPVMTTPQIVWDVGTLPAYTEITLQFRAIAHGGPTATRYYCNTISGSSPDTFIPTYKDNDGCVGILNPFGLNKEATPDAIVLGEPLEYLITIFNGSDQTYQVSEIRDYLPEYFEYNGGAVWQTNYPSPVTLPANGGIIEEAFTVVARTVPRNICNKLPANIPQVPGSVVFDVVDNGSWFNAVNIGEVMVSPQVLLNKTAFPTIVAPGDFVTYTVVLSNYTSNIYNDLIVTDTLPAGFTYISMAPGSTIQPDSVTPGLNPVIVWKNLPLTANGHLTFQFITTATLSIGTGKENKVMAISAGNPDVCIPWRGSGTGYTNAKAGPKVEVRAKNITYAKVAAPTSVGPLALVQYDLTVYNRGPYTTTNIIVTDTLPSSVAGPPPFRFYQNVNLPSGVTFLRSDPPVWSISSIGIGKSVKISFKARSTIYPGSGYKNYADAIVEPGWTFTREASYAGAPVTVVPGVGLDKVVYPTATVTGTLVVYTITVYNQSGQDVAGLRITDTLPAGFSYDSMVTTAYMPDSTSPLMWSSKLPVIKNAAQLSLVFLARVGDNQQSGTYYNQVAATAANVSIPETDDTAPVRVYGAPNVSTVKLVDPSKVFYGGTVVYSITLQNESLESLNVRVTDTLPAGFSFVMPLGDTPGPDQTSPVVWNSIALGPNAARELAFVALVAQGAPTGTVYNTVDVSAPGYTFAGTGPTAPVLVKARPTYDLQATKDGTPGLVQVGDLLTYTIAFQNQTDDNVTLADVVLTDIVPSGVTVLTTTGMVEAAPGVWNIYVGSLAPGEIGSAYMIVQVDQDPPEGFLLNTVFIDAPVPVGAEEPDRSNNASEELTYVGTLPDVQLNKTVEPALAFSGDVVTYTMSLFNNSSITVTLNLTDTMPPGFVFNQVLGSTPPPAGSNPLVWSNVRLTPQQSIVFAWRALVGLDTPPGFYYNLISWDLNGVSLPDRVDLALIETDIHRTFATQISKTDGQTTATAGQTLTYTIRYTNTSTNVTLTQVSLTDQYSPTSALTFLSSGWSPKATGVYTRAMPDLGPGRSNVVTVNLRLASSLPAGLLAITNTALLHFVPVQRATELPASVHDSTDLNIVGGADLIVTALSASPKVLYGGKLIITVTLRNQGLQATSGPDGTGWFGVDAYVKPAGVSAPSGPADRYYGICPAATSYCPGVERWNLYRAFQSYHGSGLNIGETRVITFAYNVPDALLPTRGTLWVYAQADTYWGQPGTTEFGTPANGRILEGNEINNISGPITTTLLPGLYLPIIRR
jgi:uncharacterized repeat protein (TIGR01451 family)